MRVLERYYKLVQRMVEQQILNDMVPMDISPAAKWFLGEAPQEYWRYREDFPCVLPPAPVTWLEYEMPAVIRSAKDAVARPARSVVAMILTIDIHEEEEITFLENDGLPELFGYFRRKSKMTRGVEVSADKRQESIAEARRQGLVAKWITIWQLMAEPLNQRTLVPFVAYAFYLDQNGQLIAHLGLAYTMASKEEIGERHLPHSFADVLPFLFGLSLTHCRNVEIAERELPPALIKKRQREGKPILKFKQLVIHPVGGKHVVNANRQQQPGGGMMPLHFVRAHFRTYTAERPLFGKHTGRYFVGLHARGDAKYGEIVKEYKVKNKGE